MARRSKSPDYRAVFTTVLEEYGFKHSEDLRYGYQYCRDTPLGVVLANVYDTWVAFRFEEPQRATAYFHEGLVWSPNPFSGKWNLLCGRDERTPDEVTQLLKTHLNRLPKGQSSE